MKSLLRSTFVSGPEDSKDLLLRNVTALEESGLGFDVPEDEVIWKYVRDFANQYHHVPDISTIRGHFTYVNETAVLDRLQAVSVGKPKAQGDFLTVLNEKIEERRTRKVTDILREAARIVETGIEIKEGREKKLLRGPVDAVRYLIGQSHEIVAPSTGQKLSGNVTADGTSFMDEVDRVESNPLAGIGQFTGLRQMDDALKGAKRGELWTHAAFTGNMKSTLMLNWAYNQAVFYRHSNIVFSLEMPYQQVRRILYSLHSAHPKFDEARRFFGVGKSLSYKSIRDGELDLVPEARLLGMSEAERSGLLEISGRFYDPNRSEKRFLAEYVVPDFNDPANEYGNIHIEVHDPDKSDFTVTDARNKAELLYSKDPTIASLFVDHAGLMAARQRMPSTTEKINEVVRDLKRLSMSFNRGAGIAVVNLFQISREGYKSAEKSGGRYNLTHLSYANECLLGCEPITTKRGIVPLENVKVGDSVWSRSGWKPVLNVFDQGVKPLWRVTTDRGSVLHPTGNHRVRVLEGSAFGWKGIQSLAVGDWVVSTTGDYPWPSQAVSLPSLDFLPYERACGNQGVPITTPTTLNPALAYLLGAWHGDGRTHAHGIGFTGNRNEVPVRERIEGTFLSVFNHRLGSQESPSRPGSFDLFKWSQPLKRWFDTVSGERGNQIPPAILASPKPVVLAFLQGLFDTDGWINSQHVVGLKMKSEPLLRQVQQIMGLLGYDTHLAMTPTTLAATGKTYEGWTLRLRGYDSRTLFAKEIGFTEPWKAQRLSESLLMSPRKKDTRVYPVAEAFLGLCSAHTPHRLCTERILRKSHFNTIASARRLGLVPHGAVEYLLTYLAEAGIEDPRAEFLREILRLRVMRVASVENTGREEQVYDIEVGGDHEYQTGPLLSHNCERSSDIVTAGWLDDNLKQQSLLKLQCLKSRDDQPFEDFYAGILWPCRRLFTTNAVGVEAAKQVGNDIDKMLGG